MSKQRVEPEQLYTIPETANLLGLKVSTVRKMRCRRQIAVCKPTGGRAIRIAASEIVRLQGQGEGRRREDT
jgi:excisionase family DNA binding protein